MGWLEPALPTPHLPLFSFSLPSPNSRFQPAPRAGHRISFLQAGPVMFFSLSWLSGKDQLIYLLCPSSRPPFPKGFLTLTPTSQVAHHFSHCVQQHRCLTRPRAVSSGLPPPARSVNLRHGIGGDEWIGNEQILSQSCVSWGQPPSWAGTESVDLWGSVFAAPEGMRCDLARQYIGI